MMDGWGMGGVGDGLTVGLLMLVWIVTAAATFAAGYLTARRARNVPGRPQDDAVALLRRRLAAGEIDDEQYFRLLSAMESR